MTVAQMFVYLPSLYRLHGAEIGQTESDTDKFNRACAWIKDTTGECNPSWDHIIKVMEHL